MSQRSKTSWSETIQEEQFPDESETIQQEKFLNVLPSIPSDDTESTLKQVDVSQCPSTPTVVYIMPYVEMISAVNTVDMASTIEIEMGIHWRDDRLVQKSKDGEGFEFKTEIFGDLDPEEATSWEKVWHPTLRLERTAGDVATGLPEVLNMEIVRTAEGMPHIFMYVSFNYRVDHKFFLRPFPFDIQVLDYTFVLQDQPSLTCAILVPHCLSHILDAKGVFSEGAECMVDGITHVAARLVPHVCEQEWSRVMTNFGLASEMDRQSIIAGGALLYSQITLKVLAKRNVTFFGFKIIGVVFLLICMAPMVFVMEADSDGLSDRINVSLTLFLTAVALQYAIHDYLPVLPYLTAIDRIILFMYALYAGCYFENFVVYTIAVATSSSQDVDAARTIDLVSVIIYSVFTLVGLLDMAWNYWKGTRVPESYTHVGENMLKIIPQRDKESIDPHVLKQLEMIPKNGGPKTWEQDTYYRISLQRPWARLEESINA